MTEELLRWTRERTTDGGAEPPVFRLQRWIRDAPERVWEVLLELVARAPNDAEVMEFVAWHVSVLLNHDFAAFHDRAASLLAKSKCLDRLLGPEVFVEAEYGPRCSEPEQLAPMWLDRVRVRGLLPDPERSAHNDPRSRVRFALEVIERGPAFGFDTDDVDGPLLDVFREFGGDVIEEIESAARRSVAVRRVIWNVRRLQYSTPAELWARFQAAAAGTTLCNSDLPPAEFHRLDQQDEEEIAAWFQYRSKLWTFDAVADLVRDSPDDAWRAVVAITRAAQSLDELVICGAGHLEDLIREHPERFIERAEALAASEASFRDALGAAWLTLEDVPEPLAFRYHAASGRQLRVLDAPEGWPEHAPREG